MGKKKRKEEEKCNPHKCSSLVARLALGVMHHLRFTATENSEPNLLNATELSETAL